MQKTAKIFLILAMALTGASVQADDAKVDKNASGDKTVWQKTKDGADEIKDDTVDGTKKAYRKVKDKTCEMINGKMECAAKKVGNSIKTGADKVGDKADDLKKKVE